MNRATSPVAQPYHTHSAHSSHRQPRRAGLTLIEMMVSVTITLMVVFAIVQVFDMIGSTVAMGRATIEMAGQLRSVSQQLQQDLDNITCPVKPWLDPDAGLGYFEYVEGPLDIQFTSSTVVNHRSCDWDHDADTFGLHQTTPSDAQFPGDIDDVLSFTSRMPGDSEFVGRFAGGTVSSKFAEVVWWMAIMDTNGNQLPDANDTPVLLRRAFLIRPDLDVSGNTPDVFFFFNDISAGISETGALTANSLGDVTNRQNRFAHRPPYVDGSNNPYGMPHDLAIFVIDDPDDSSDDVLIETPDTESFPFEHEQLANNRNVDTMAAVSGSEIQLESWLEAQGVGTSTPSPNDYPYPSAMIPRFITQEAMNAVWSQFVVAIDVVAFDVRIYDPEALGYINSTVPVMPSDAGYAGPYELVGSGTNGERYEASWQSLSNLVTGLPGNAGLFFRGGYVDLQWRRSISNAYQANLTSLNTLADGKGLTLEGMFSEYTPMQIKESQFVFYDTWSLGFEKDGINQDHEEDDDVDEGFDGLDTVDAGGGVVVDGVDDIDERETSPPYDVAPRGIEVRIRQIEVSTGQVRQVSVVGDFTN